MNSRRATTREIVEETRRVQQQSPMGSCFSNVSFPAIVIRAQNVSESPERSPTDLFTRREHRSMSVKMPKSRAGLVFPARSLKYACGELSATGNSNFRFKSFPAKTVCEHLTNGDGVN